MMQWEKRLNWGAHRQSGWMYNSALQPTSIMIGDRIRVFCGIRDKMGLAGSEILILMQKTRRKFWK